ncbi:MAG TPA: ABC transporter ATP-binding protein [Microbacterium sp.]|uniref:ABC transporter ATP-binding protein n=1 Tax=Microbacterium sp. TaxID=51671 RepID=UPI002B48CAA1|nr:ABC transporter ATP-binding protein [Microbacterium sp.]HKT55669.1 ABC transporter ATP-binding protein [Microbacterium sp.]
MPETVVRTCALTRTYVKGGETVHACDGIDLEVPAGEFLVIRGRSGAGKTTLMSLLGGLVRPTAGMVEVCGQDVGGASESRLVALRRSALAGIPQEFGLLDALTAAENVEVPLRLDAVSPKRRDRLVAEALDAVGLAKHGRQRPGELSGGQQQRVAIARALVRPSRVLLADEPTGSLDSATAAAITDALHAYARTHGTAVLVTTHDPVVVARADRVLEMHDGRLRDTPAPGR